MPSRYNGASRPWNCLSKRASFLALCTLHATEPAELCMDEIFVPGNDGKSTGCFIAFVACRAGNRPVPCIIVFMRRAPREADLARFGGGPDGRGGGGEAGSLLRPKREHGLLGKSSPKSSDIAEGIFMEFVGFPCMLEEGWEGVTRFFRMKAWWPRPS